MEVFDADDVALRDGKVFCEAAGTINTNPLCVRTEVEVAFAAIVAMPADDVSLAGDHFTRFEFRDGGANFFDDAAKFMPHMHADRNSLLSPGIPVPDVEICAAYGCFIDFDEHIIRSHLRHGNIHELKSAIGFCLDERFHERHHTPPDRKIKPNLPKILWSKREKKGASTQSRCALHKRGE